MKNKFIKILITINGILLFPLLIFLIYELVNEKLKKDNNEYNDWLENKAISMTMKLNEVRGKKASR
jgi:hypothetical protein